MKITRKAGKIESLRQTVKALDAGTGRVGWFPSAKYEEGQPVAGIAMVQEFGSPARGIPPRSFMRTTAEEKQTEWAKSVAQLTKAAALGKLAPANIMPALCMVAEGHVRQTISKISAPPLKPATVAARKRRMANGGKGAKSSIAKPLVDTGILLNTLTSETE